MLKEVKGDVLKEKINESKELGKMRDEFIEALIEKLIRYLVENKEKLENDNMCQTSLVMLLKPLFEMLNTCQVVNQNWKRSLQKIVKVLNKIIDQIN